MLAINLRAGQKAIYIMGIHINVIANIYQRIDVKYSCERLTKFEPLGSYDAYYDNYVKQIKPHKNGTNMGSLQGWSVVRSTKYASG